MSDAPELAERLTEKFDYTNTFTIRLPGIRRHHTRTRVTMPATISSLPDEVLEHVPPPVEQSFANLYTLPKPDGLLLMTTPYTIGGQTREHYPELHQYTLASIAGRAVLGRTEDAMA